ncbi:MAG: type III pantothenate kinase [Cyclobacteriaceae bacterium]|nr:type III pantothenate kinase [Cyclobacteriaceae bacterium]MCX7637001.1 type III pantothenate kinase [Cyclobacteriaceae bacterium]MDW8330124.1 type III pantothenate kinase [Cyclobacteriaceae bacterium]
MILCLDVGNTTIHGGVYQGDNLITQFRKMSRQHFSADEAGLFFKSVLRENGVDVNQITGIAVCSVVPAVNHSLRGACQKYLGKEPFFLRPGVKTGLKVKYRNPVEVGADRIANAIGAVHLYPGKNIIVIDFGTATTFCAISKERDYLGGIIVPGVRISMEALERETAQLPTVEITEVDHVIGKSTVESIQSGLYHGQVGMVRELIKGITREAFAEDTPLIIGTGGFSRLFENARLFDVIIPTLVLDGLRIAYQLNQNN